MVRAGAFAKIMNAGISLTNISSAVPPMTPLEGQGRELNNFMS
jgi:hypothetical protein